MDELSSLGHYPKVYLSKYHIDKDAYREFKPVLQTVPDKIEYNEPETKELGCIGWSIGFIFCIFLAGVVGDGLGMAFFMFFAFLGLPLIFAIYSSNVSKENRTIIEQSKNRFNEFVEKRNSIVRANKEKLSDFENLLFSNNRKEALKYIITDINTRVREEANPKIGASEIVFHSFINRSNIANLVHLNVAVSNEGSQFYPDLALIDEENSIYIDVEIDEPYTYNDLLPIHHDGIDNERNYFFNRIGWTVVRFSEKQIVQQPIEVIAFIDKVYQQLLNHEPVEDELKLNSDACWSKEQAESMATRNYRNSYRT